MANNASISNISIDLTELSSDTSPQLGGNLDLNSNNITGTGNINTTGTITASSAITGNTFSGSGASLTNLNASNLASGTIPDARFPSALPAVDGSNLTGINTDLVSDTTPQLGGNLDTNGNDIEVGASDRITLGGIASGSYPEFQIKSTGSVNQLLAYDGQIDFGRPSGGPFKLKLSQPSGAGGTSIELNSNTTGGHQRINAAQTAVPFELQYGGSTKLNIDSSAVAVTGNLTTTGTVTPGAYRPGEVIEEISATCDGSTVSVLSGNYTITNVTTHQNGSTSYVTVNGSSISYTPPAGTKRVYYRFWYHYDVTENSGISHHIMQIDGTDVYGSANCVSSNYASSNWHHAGFPISVEYTIDCDASSTSASAGQFTSWTSAKTLRTRYREYSGSYESRLHRNTWWNGTSASGNYTLMKPHLTIRAIG